jgi:hypothetical protein
MLNMEDTITLIALLEMMLLCATSIVEAADSLDYMLGNNEWIEDSF